MEKIIPFKKDIEFENISEIKSISLEHSLSNEGNLISGSFIVSGTYKMTELSVNVDEFNYDLPFKISIDDKYDTDDLKLDINDFYYEVTNNKVLSVNIEVKLENLKEKKLNRQSFDVLEEELKGDAVIEDDREVEGTESEQLEKTFTDDVDNGEEECAQKEIITSIFDTDDNENYVTYKIHVVGENDTIETILQKYEVPLSKLEDYNDVSDLKIGDKIIIPN